MIDLHTHILFGVDDGCRTIEESIVLIQKAMENGITNIFLTPHYNPIGTESASTALIIKNFKLLQQEVKERELSCNLFLGREIYGTKEITTLLKKDVSLSMEHSKYVLIDFGLEKTDIDEYCYHLVLNGYIPIIAHPERYKYIKDVSIYKAWRETGALIQVDSRSFFVNKRKNTYKNTQYLLKNNLIDFIGSDTHRTERSLQYFKKIVEKLDDNIVLKIQNNAKKLLRSARQTT